MTSVGNACGYEIGTGSNRGLKTGDTYLKDVSGSAATAWTQSYGYDSNFDYLTSASYGDGQPNASQSWTYDAAGNRTSDYTGSSWAYDNLNRMTSNGAGTSLSNDVLGNRTALGTGSGATTYTWDCLNRLAATVVPGSSPAHNSYTYRADGMRVEKILHSGIYSFGSGITEIDVYARYRYDGQMPMETFITKADSSTVVMENGLGARGIDYGTVTTSSGTTVHFPIYDAHGNEVATLSRSGSSYSLTNQRSYGAWGEIRQGNTTGGPRGRYCGDLGHVQDDETSLVYMRARYYESGSGRFVSQDRDLHCLNRYSYCANDPINCEDEDGDTRTTTIIWRVFGVLDQVLLLLAIVKGTLKEIMSTAGGAAGLMIGVTFLGIWFGGGMDTNPAFGDLGDRTTAFAITTAGLGALAITLAIIASGVELSKGSIASNAIGLLAAYAATIAMFIALDDADQAISGTGG